MNEEVIEALEREDKCEECGNTLFNIVFFKEKKDYHPPILFIRCSNCKHLIPFNVEVKNG